MGNEFLKISDDAKVFSRLSSYKSKIYFLNRFFKHPIYQYIFYTIKNRNEVLAILVARVCGNYMGKCLRIVDFIGDITAISGVRNQLMGIMGEFDYEYIDFMVVGLEDKELQNAGFKRRRDYSDVILPNYFEPFVRENIDLDYAYKSIDKREEIIFFKADADQDRPNLLDDLETRLV